MSNRLRISMGRQPGPKIHNVVTGRVIPCVWSDCDNDANDNITIAVPNDRDPDFPGQLRIYAFCSELHRQWWYNQQAGNPHATL